MRSLLPSTFARMSLLAVRERRLPKTNALSLRPMGTCSFITWTVSLKSPQRTVRRLHVADVAVKYAGPIMKWRGGSGFDHDCNPESRWPVKSRQIRPQHIRIARPRSTNLASGFGTVQYATPVITFSKLAALNSTCVVTCQAPGVVGSTVGILMNTYE